MSTYPSSFPGARFDPYMLTVTPIHLKFNNDIFAHGTGFIWRGPTSYYLVTNWHNLSGLNPFTGSHLNSSGCVPDSITFYPAVKQSIREIDGVLRGRCDIELWHEFENPLWIQHRGFDEFRIDIAAIPISTAGEELFCVNQFEEVDVFTHVGHDLFVVGYPFDPAIGDSAMLPIWKRGSLASDAALGWDNKPAYLIDCASRAGMSGSPVFRRVFGPRPYLEGAGFGIAVDNIVSTRFVGIYSGHLLDNQDRITIGIGWERFLIDQMINSPDPGRRLYL